MVNMKKSGNWIRDNSFNLIITLLLGIIAYGGREGIQFIKTSIENQNQINVRQGEFNLMIIKKSVTHDGAVEMMKSVNSTNETQGTTIMNNCNKITEHEVRIKHLEDDN